jgi:hypothetical protein
MSVEHTREVMNRYFADAAAQLEHSWRKPKDLRWGAAL